MNNLNQLLSGNLNAGEIVPYLGPDNGKAESIKRLKEWTQDRKFRQSGNDLSWNVSKRPIFLDGKDTGFSAIQRDDTGKVFQMAKSYEIMQNWETLQLCEISAGEAGYNLSNLGYLGDGELIFIQATTGKTVVGNSGITKYVTVLNSHDGSTALKWGNSMINVICLNTFYMAYRSIQNAAKHTVNMRDRIKGMLNAFASAAKQEKSLYDDLARLVDTPLSKQAIFTVVETVFDVKEADINKAPTRTQNQIRELKDSVTLEINRQGNNLWGLFNGVTHYTTHKAGRDEDNRDKSKMTGQGQRRDNDVLEQLLNLVPVRTLVTV